MTTTAEAFVTQLLLDSLNAFFIIGALFSLIIGMLLIIRPSLALKIDRYMSRNFSLRRSLKPLELPRSAVEQHFYRHHHGFGLMLIFFSSYILYTMLFNFQLHAIAQALGNGISLQARLWLLESLRAFLTLSSSLIILLGYLVYSRPSQLKKIEEVANRWLSTRRALRFLDMSYEGPSSSVQHRPKVWGVVIVLGSIFILLTLKWP